MNLQFANQRQRKGWPVQKQEQQHQEGSNSIVEEPEEEEEHQSSPAKSFLSASQSSSTASIIERSPTPLTPFSASSACPSLSSSTSSRSSSDSYAPSPSRAFFHPHQDVINQLPTFDFNIQQQQEAAPAPVASSPVLDIDQLIRQLTPPHQPAIPDVPSISTFNPCIPTFIPTPPSEKASNGPFAYNSENEDANMSGCGSGESTPPIPQDTFQWLPINMQGLLPQSEATLSQTQSAEDFTPQAAQFTFAPLQLDTSSYLQQSPSHNVDLSSVMPSAQQKQADEGITIAQPEANWSDIFLKDMETWGKQPQQAQLQLNL
ncbi:hypothetical protein P389DRAFT_168593 [Cystobasidium minutum MCA 4210]|uniref:uncharacterized protein n=1 Tax=Cystobasidium minutum MCA 4210 TaxID=1397322 RepID=UPI0034CDDBE9|eukprot:jgi/Rhomi1/168593/fgenesh1_kg.3_\